MYDFVCYSGGRVAGVVVGILVFIAIIGLCIFCACRCRKRRQQQQGTVLNAGKDAPGMVKPNITISSTSHSIYWVQSRYNVLLGEAEKTPKNQRILKTDFGVEICIS